MYQLPVSSLAKALATSSQARGALYTQQLRRPIDATPEEFGRFTFRRILVAVDGSPAANEALSVAVDLAERYAASLHLLHASPLLPEPALFAEVLAARRAVGEVILESMRRPVGDRVAVSAELVEGPVVQTIVRVAEESDFDLIVLGAQSDGDEPGFRLDSIGDAVASKATCPVLLVRGVSISRL